MGKPGILGLDHGGAAPAAPPVGPRTHPTHPRHGTHAHPASHPRHQEAPDEMPPPGYYSDTGWTFRYETFFAECERWKFPAITPEQKVNLGKLLGYIEKDTQVTDLRWAAYMLATVRRECGGNWLPIEEGGKGAGHDYGQPVAIKDAAGKVSNQTYYGRGFVQLTWEKNYRSAGAELHRLNLVSSDDELVLHPERALEPALAYPIMSFGMRKGIFTGVSLKHYIHGSTCDYFNARRIINGTDVAAQIEGYAKTLQKALYASSLMVGDFDPHPQYAFLA